MYLVRFESVKASVGAFLPPDHILFDMISCHQTDHVLSDKGAR